MANHFVFHIATTYRKLHGQIPTAVAPNKTVRQSQAIMVFLLGCRILVSDTEPKSREKKQDQWQNTAMSPRSQRRGRVVVRSEVHLMLAASMSRGKGMFEIETLVVEAVFLGCRSDI